MTFHLQIAAVRMKSASLKKKKDILRAFSEGKSNLKHPIVVKWYWTDKESQSSPSFLFTPAVSAKKIKRAVDRNLIKRRIREAVRNNPPKSPIFESPENNQLRAVYIFIGGDTSTYQRIEKAVGYLNSRLN